MTPPRPGFPWKKTGVAVVLVAVFTGVVWAGWFYQAHAAPSVSLAGIPVGFMTRGEVKQVAARATAKLRVTFKAGDIVKTPPLQRIGVRIDQAATVRAVFAARRINDMPGALALWQAKTVPLRMSIDQAKLRQYLRQVFSRAYEPPRPPTARFAPDKQRFVLIPGQPGHGFDAEAIAHKIASRADNPGRLRFTADQQAVALDISRTEARRTLARASQRLYLDLRLLYQQKLIYAPEPAQIAQWMKFVPTDSGLAVHYQRGAIRGFLRGEVEASLNRFFGPGTNRPRSSQRPLQLADTRALVNDIVHALQRGEPLTKEVTAAPVNAPGGTAS